jgi:hypothetical protein
VSFGVGSPFRSACHSRPAMAGGIQSFDGAFPKVCRVDSRFRWNDCGLHRPGLANDASTRLSCPDVFGRDCPAPTKLSSTFWYAEKGGRGCPSLLEGGRACGRTRHMSSPSDWTPPKRFSWFATSLPREEGDGCYLRQKDRSAPAAPPLECLKQKQFRGQRAFEAHRDTLLH